MHFHLFEESKRFPVGVGDVAVFDWCIGNRGPLFVTLKFLPRPGILLAVVGISKDVLSL